MSILSTIRLPIQAELDRFTTLFNGVLSSDNYLLEHTLSLVKEQHGKMMRPMLMLLLAKSTHTVTPVTYHAAVAFELLHTASLVHDDVVDFSDLRRGHPSLNSVFGNKVAVLTGDFLLATALYHSSLTYDPRIVSILSQIGRDLSEGELWQLATLSDSIVSEETYFHIIRKKTASLFSASAKAAVLSAGGTLEEAEKAYAFGDSIGVCFQIKDDIFDYYSSSDLGKPTGSDMLDRKLTLPIIYVLHKLNNPVYNDLAVRVLKGTSTKEDVTVLIALAKEQGGITYANEVLNSYKEKACSYLDSIEDSALRDSLSLYLDFLMNRTK